MSFIEDRINMFNELSAKGELQYLDVGRRTGKSVAFAFATISNAMLNMEEYVILTDHYSSAPKFIKYIQIPIITNLIKTLELEGFYIKNGKELVYSLDPNFLKTQNTDENVIKELK